MRSFNVMALLCLNLILTSCDPEFKNKDSQAESSIDSTTHINSQNLSDYIQVNIQPTNKPEHYMVYFSWPSIDDHKKIRIRSNQFSLVVENTQNTFSHEVSHNQKLTYSFEVLNENNITEKSFSKLVTIPQDYVVRAGQNQLTENTKLKVKRFFISDVPFVTNGFSFELDTEILNSDKGVITTFSENQKASSDQDGRSGGVIFIKSEIATGVLKVSLRGENGGNGSKGSSYSNRAADGSPPSGGRQVCEPTGHHILSNSLVLQPQVCLCEVSGTNGGNGSDGFKGRKGNRAGNGGNSGQLKVQIKSASDFEIQTERFVGVRGEPGDGGDGQQGGIAQDASPTERCRGSKGHDGATGPQGDRGDQGQDGVNELICIYLASEGRNDCF